MNVGDAIKMCRARRGLTQAQVAQSARISVSYLSLLEKNKRDATVTTLKEIAIALNVPVGILFFLATEKSELAGLSEELAASLSRAALMFLNEPDKTQALL